MIKKNLEELKARIRKICEGCGRDPSEIRIVAVSKNHPVESIQEAYDAGIRDFGENRVQELKSKTGLLPDDIVWHMVGAVQTNKIRDLVPRTGWVHSVSRPKYLQEMEKRASRADRIMRVLIQVNISDEAQKSGCRPEDLGGVLRYASELKQVEVHGLMGMATLTSDRDLIRRQFRMLRRLRDEHRALYGGNVRLDELSMGMSGDFDIAIEEGATMIRLGTTLFGERNAD